MITRTPVHTLATLFTYAERLASPLMRISLGLTLLWIGWIDLLDPRDVVGLLAQTLPVLAFNQFVYALKVLEIIGGILLIAGVWVRYVALTSLGLFAGTLTIFVTAPGVTEFPLLSLIGQFLLKDTVLASVAIALMASDAASHATQPTPTFFKALFDLAERVAGPLLRVSLGVVLLWIGCVHLFEPQPVVTLLSHALPFLAFSTFVYLLGGVEIIAGTLLLAGRWIRYVALLTLVLFASTLTILVIAPDVTGFPVLTTMGQFLLKNTVLASAAIALVARDAASHAGMLPRRSEMQSPSEGLDIRRPAA